MKLCTLLILLCFLSTTVFSSPSNSTSHRVYQDSTLFQQKIDSADIYLLSDISKASQLYQEALTLVSTTNNDELKADIYSRLGTLERMKSNYVMALEYHLKSLKIHEKNADSLKMGENFHGIGIVMRYQKEYDDAEAYFKKAIVLRKQFNDTLGLGGSHSMLGVIYRRQKKYTEAEEEYMKALKLFTQLNNKKEIVHINGNLASLYYFQREYSKSNETNLSDLQYLKETNNKSSLATRYANIAKGYEKLKNHKTAIVYFDSVITISKEQGYIRQLSTNYNGRSKNYYLTKDYENALNDYRAYKKTNDSVYNLKNTKEITTLLLKAEFEKQQAMDSIQFSVKEKNLQLVATSEKSKNNIYLLLLFIAISLGITFFYVSKQKKKIVLTTLKNKELQAQVLEQKLEINQSETERIINEKSISLSYKQQLHSLIKDLLKKGETTTVFKDLNILNMELDHQIKAEESESVKDSDIENLHVQFEKKLISLYPTLSKTEREICSLILANRSIKDIVSIKGVSSASVQSARYRIRKKLDLQKGEELQQFLKGLA